MFDHILVPLDGSPLAEGALAHSVALAQAFAARLTLLRVLQRTPEAEPLHFVNALDWRVARAEAQTYLDGLASRLQGAGLSVSTAVAEGEAAERIIEFAQGHGVDLIVISNHGESGLSGWNISSVAQKVVRRAYMSTLIVRAYQATSPDPAGLRYRRLLVPLDGSPRAEYALPLAASLARAQGAELLLAHVVARPALPGRTPPAPEDEALLERLVERSRLEGGRYLQEMGSWLSSEGTSVREALLVGDSVAAALHGLVEDEGVDLVLMTAHGHSGDGRWPYGSVAVSLIARGTTPLLLVQDVPFERVQPTPAEMATKAQGAYAR